MRKERPPVGAIVYFSLTVLAGLYFAYSAVQGEIGLFRRAEIKAQVAELQVELSRLQADVVWLENLTRRLSDHNLDLDLLDERARKVLGLIRQDEVILIR